MPWVFVQKSYRPTRPVDADLFPQDLRLPQSICLPVTFLLELSASVDVHPCPNIMDGKFFFTDDVLRRNPMAMTLPKKDRPQPTDGRPRGSAGWAAPLR
jgi:hypothetical protein